MDDGGNPIKGFKQTNLFNGPTLTRTSDTNQKLIGTGLFRKKTEGNLTKTFG